MAPVVADPVVPEVEGGEVGEVLGDGWWRRRRRSCCSQVEGGEVGEVLGDGGGPSSPICCRRG